MKLPFNLFVLVKINNYNKDNKPSDEIQANYEVIAI